MERPKAGIVGNMVLILCFSLLILSAVAVPASIVGTFNSLTQPLSIQDLCAQGKVDSRICNEILWKEEGIIKRMTLAEEDYTGPGSNPDHDPIPPPASP